MKAFGQASQTKTWDLRTGMERREQIRFGVRALVKFEWFDEKGNRHREQGFTRDISSKGMFIFSDSPPPAKVDIQAEILFYCIAGADVNLDLRVNALVLRLESVSKSGAPDGFAVLNRSYSIADQGSMSDPEEDSINEPN